MMGVCLNAEAWAGSSRLSGGMLLRGNPSPPSVLSAAGKEGEGVHEPAGEVRGEGCGDVRFAVACP